MRCCDEGSAASRPLRAHDRIRFVQRLFARPGGLAFRRKMASCPTNRMKLELTIDGTDRSFEMLEPAPQCRFRFGDGPETTADIETPQPGVYSILINGRSYDASVEETAGGLVVVIDGHRFEIEVRDPRRRSRKTTGRHEGVQEVVAPMPGKVVRVLVKVGDAVKAGQGLVVVEAMKMQNELKAMRDGTVSRVAAREGATVAAGEVLATIE